MTKTVEIPLPWTSPPLSLNHRRNRWAHAALVAEVRKAGFVLAKHHRLGGPWPQIVVTLHYAPRVRRTRDADNPVGTLKVLCDGLVDAGVTADDDTSRMVKKMPVIHPAEGGRGRLWLVVEIHRSAVGEAS